MRHKNSFSKLSSFTSEKVGVRLKNIFTVLAILSSSLFYAQEYSFKNYDWNDKATAIEIPEKYKN